MLQLMRGGEYLGKFRSWIQTNCVRGEDIIWGCDETVHFKYNFTHKEFEKIVMDAVETDRKDMIKMFLHLLELKDRINNTEDEFDRDWDQKRLDSDINELKEYLNKPII